MVRLLGAAPSVAGDAATKLYVDTGDNGVFRPADSGYKMTNFDPAATGGVGTALAANGVLYAQRLRIDINDTITNLISHVTSAGATLTTAQNFMGLYNAAGTLLSATADQSTAWSTGGAGYKVAALSAAQAVTPGYYFIVFLSNGTTRPSMLRSATGSQAITGPATGLNARFSTGGTALTALPATLPTMTASNVGYWVAAT